MILDPADFAALAAEANLAPSVHNTQPTRWRLAPDGAVEVLEDVSRRLPVGDPLGRDAGVSHGAAIEGFALAAGERGWSVAVEPLEVPPADGLRPVARLVLGPGGEADPLRASVSARRTYRGRYAESAPKDLASLERCGDAHVVGDEGVAHLARLNDVGALKTFRDGAFRAELLSWMRLSRRDRRWALDGLNGDAMAMSPMEAAGAGVVLRRGVFETLDRLGLAATLTGEAQVVRSALAIVLFHRPEGEPPLVTGRRFYRLWLEFTALGLAAAPMAVLADDPELRKDVESRFRIPAGRRLITTFRVGVIEQDREAARARLPLPQIMA